MIMLLYCYDNTIVNSYLRNRPQIFVGIKCAAHFFCKQKKQALDPDNFRRCAFLVASNSGSKWTLSRARHFPVYRRKPTCYIVPTVSVLWLTIWKANRVLGYALTSAEWVH